MSDDLVERARKAAGLLTCLADEIEELRATRRADRERVREEYREHFRECLERAGSLRQDAPEVKASIELLEGLMRWEPALATPTPAQGDER